LRDSLCSAISARAKMVGDRGLLLTKEEASIFFFGDKG